MLGHASTRKINLANKKKLLHIIVVNYTDPALIESDIGGPP